MTALASVMYCLMVNLLSFGVMYFIAILSFCFSRKRKKHFVPIFIPFLIIYLTVIVFGNLGYYSEVFIFSDRTSQIASLLENELKLPMLFLTLAMSVGVCAFLFELTWRDILFFATAGYLMQHIPVSFYAMYLSFGFERNVYVFALFYALIYGIFYFTIVKRVRKEEIQTDSKVLLISSIVSALVIFLFEFIYTVNTYFTANLYKFISCIIMLLLSFGYFREGKILKEHQELEYILKAEQKHYADLRESMDIINIKCHDLKYKIACLKNTENSSDRMAMLDKLSQDVEIYGNINLTDNETLNVILAEKNLLCDKHGIKIYCIADGKALDFMDVPDMYALLGNAFDNAIEYLLKIDDVNKRAVYVNVRALGDVVSVHIENYFEGELNYGKDNNITTTKKDKSIHGYGLKSINYIVQKYNGEISISNKNNAFIINMIFPIIKRQFK